MRVVAAFASAVLWVCLGVLPSYAEKRVALVIGNNVYSNLPADQQLQKAVNDARAVGDALSGMGFQVIRGENLGRQALLAKFDELTQRLEPGDTAFFFFAGHGVAVGGGNFILPADVPNVGPGQDMLLARASLGENDIVSDLQARGVRVAVVVLDACRNNPFKRPGVRAVGSDQGLGRIEPVRGVFTLYSAGIGQMALDGLGDADRNPNSVFTRVFAPALARRGVDLKELATEVREEVARLAASVRHDQRPAYYDETIGGPVYLAGLPREEKPPSVKPADPCAAAADHWRSAEAIGNLAAFEDHVARFPNCPFAGLAKSNIAKLTMPSRTTDPRQFDGFWITRVVCEGKGDVQGFSYEFVGRVKDGVFHGWRGVEGEPGWTSFDGTIEPDGRIEMSWKGLTGPDQRSTLNHVPPGVPYSARAYGTFEGSQGSAIRIEGRTCHLGFTKQENLKSKVAVGIPTLPEQDVHRFDGFWTVTLVCPNNPSARLPGLTFQFGATVKDGIFRGHRGIEGKPGGQVFDGTIDPDGTTRIFAKGLSGDTKSDPFHRPTGTEFRYTIAGKLEGSHGKASRVDRDCDVSFVKR
jgi:hypothetical protein